MQIVIKKTPFYDEGYLTLMDIYWFDKQNEKTIEIGKLTLSKGIKNPNIKLKLARAQKVINNSKNRSNG